MKVNDEINVMLPRKFWPWPFREMSGSEYGEFLVIVLQLSEKEVVVRIDDPNGTYFDIAIPRDQFPEPETEQRRKNVESEGGKRDDSGRNRHARRG